MLLKTRLIVKRNSRRTTLLDYSNLALTNSLVATSRCEKDLAPSRNPEEQDA